ncbi:ewing's tumor-associated antigen 1 [Echeneis naucrates]|uniref:Uncharacterized LOC115058373 n=1 Tax=Echeneis naucrates TaxID=173247 RepID=A0A665STS7_ECHNA|nr:uncharacterized protein LOC115058373 [Echeneis naucrates]
MDGHRGLSEPPASLPGSPRGKRPARLKPNRLSRSSRPAEGCVFKTPTQISRSRPVGGVSGESPHNDSDFQHDIVWDAASPSPNRLLAKRGKKQTSAAVNISEMVRRIAPKHGRPAVAEPALQRWIGDSASISCTPDVPVRSRRKPLRTNVVDDLMKLAKQFDFNMFHEFEDEVQAELRPEDVLGRDLDFIQSSDGDRQPPNVAAGTDVQAHIDLRMDDDLDLLFDGTTQHISGDLSQLSGVKPAVASETSGKPPTTTNDEFEDDWEIDDLNDSLLLEMTQSPLHSSTQRPTRDAKHQTTVPFSQSVAPKVPTETGRQRTTFALKSNPDFSVKAIQTEARTKWLVDSQLAWRPPADTEKSGLRPETDQKTGRPPGPDAGSSHSQPAAVSDILEDELEAAFSSDVFWDSPEDDVLLCEICEDLENQIQDVDGLIPKRTVNPRAGESWRGQPANQLPSHHRQPPLTVPAASAPTSSGSWRQQGGGSSQLYTAAPLPTGGHAGQDRFAFQRANHQVSMETSKALGKCSAAEIELKKQQAMERRRQRLKVAQNVRAPT